MGKFIDLTNRIFDRLTVLERADDYIAPNGRHITMWKCKCECGKEDVLVRSSSLITKNTKSCGCLHIENSKLNLPNNDKNNNIYDLSGDIGIGYTNKGEEFYFDLGEYDLIKKFCWFKTELDYIRAKIAGTNKHIFLHKLIMNDFDDVLTIDHKNGKPYDCQKLNLRIADDSKNNMNKPLQRNNTSGTRGVTWHKRDCIWEVNISVNNKRIYLGRYNDYDEAVSVRSAANEKYFGEWSYENSRKI